MGLKKSIFASFLIIIRLFALIFHRLKNKVRVLKSDGSLIETSISNLGHYFPPKDDISKRLVFFWTESPDSTYGDLVLAKRVMDTLKKQKDNLVFVWNIKSNNRKKVQDFVPRDVTTIIYSDWKFLNLPIISKVFKVPDAHIAFSVHAAKRLAKRYDNTMFFFEYDYSYRTNVYRLENGILPGFCDECRGIFIKNEITLPAVSSEKVKFFQNKFSQNNSQTYERYFGYFNKLKSVHSNTNGNLENWVTIVILKEIMDYFDRKTNTSKVIDIIVPATEEQYLFIIKRLQSSLPKVLNKNLDFIAYNYADTGNYQNIIKKVGLTFNIINIFPMKLEESLHFMKMSNVFVGTTRDQSFTEALSESKIAYYQTMKWKYNLLTNFIAFSETILEPHSPLLKFYKSLLGPNKTFIELFEMATFLNSQRERMHHDAKVLHKAILEKKDLHKHILPKLEQILRQYSPECKLFPDLTSEFNPTQNNEKPLKIPKIIHYVWHAWDNKTQPPEQYLIWRKRMRELHPDWQFMYWDLQKSSEFIKTNYHAFYELYSKYDKPVKRSDAIRYFILDHFGGVYMDMSFFPVKNIEPLLKGYEFVAAEETESPHVVNMAFMASIPKYPLITQILSHLNQHFDKYVLQSTGPKFFTSEIANFIMNHPHSNVKILPRKFIYPFGWWKKEKYSKEAIACLADPNKCNYYKDAYLIKKWGNSWAYQYK